MDLEKFLLKELIEICKQLGIYDSSKKKKSELIKVLEDHIGENPNYIIANGKLDIMTDGYGFLRETSVEKDIYVSSSQIKRFKMRTGDIITGEVRKPVGDEKNYALRKVLFVDGNFTRDAESRIPFEELTPSYPTEMFKLETNHKNTSGRMIDLIAPIGRKEYFFLYVL